MPNKIYRQGTDKVAQSIRGLRSHYQTFFRFTRNPYPFALYHGVTMDTAWKILDCGKIEHEEERMQAVSKITSTARYHRKRWAKGGRNSAKTFSAAYTFLCLMVYIEKNLGIMLRHNWRTVETTMMAEFVEMVHIATDGHPEYLVRHLGKQKKPWKHHVGYYESVVFTAGQPSKVLVLPEPDESDPRAVADALKSPQGGLGAYWIDELSEVREVVDSTLEDNMRRVVPVHAGLGTTNPFTQGTWGYRISREEEAKQIAGKPTRVLILGSSMYDNPFANPENIKAMEEKYKDDPVEYRLQVEGKDVRPVKGKAVFKREFNRKIHVNADIRVSPLLDLYVGIDWGYHHPAAVFCQKDDRGRWMVFGELVLEDVGLRGFADEIFSFLKQHYPFHYYDPAKVSRHQRRVHFWCDPAGSFKRDRGDTTIDEFAEYGIHCEYREDSRMPEMRANIMRNMLTTLIDGVPVLQVHPRCSVFIDGCEYGYHYHVARSGKIGKVPAKDGYFEHTFDAAGYLFHGVYGHHAHSMKKRTEQLKARRKRGGLV